jgi:hypothetical protein
MTNFSSRTCDLHPECTMTFDSIKKQWFCEKCDASEGSMQREIDFVGFIKKKEKEGRKQQELDTVKGNYMARVIFADETHVVQNLGRFEFVIHDQFDPLLTEGDAVINIKYKDDLGVVKVNEVDKSLGR